MAFIMRVSKSGKLICMVSVLAWLAVAPARAEAPAVTVKSAELHAFGSQYYLSADIDYALSGRAMEALRNGIPLFWDVCLTISRPRKHLWNLTVAGVELRFRIQYHALLNMYRVRNENSGVVYNFSTLSAALDQMSSIRDIPVFAKKSLAAETGNLAEIRVVFDREALPLPLRPIAYLNSQWYLSSDRFVWPLTK